MADTYKYLGVVLDNKLAWTTNTEAVYKKGLSRFFLPEEAQVLQCLQPDAPDESDHSDQSVVASTILLAVVSWGAGIKVKNGNRLNKLI